jgi:PAS domain S-box-containing protein
LTEAEGQARQSWVRLVFRPLEGFVFAAGDCRGLLGVEGRALIDSPEPLQLLPEFMRDLLLSGDPDQPALVRGESVCGTARPTDEGLEILLFRSRGWKGEGSHLVEDLAAGVAGVDVKGVVRIWNRTMENIFHIPRDYAIGKRLEDLLRPPLLYSWDSVISRTLQGRQMKVECRPGQDRRVEARFSQTSSGAVGTFLDTTESYLTEKRLRTNRKMNQAYFQSIRSGLVLFGSDYRILVSNRAFGNMFGASESLLGMPLYEVLPEDSFRRIETASKEIFDGREGTESDLGVVEYQRPDGSSAVVTQRIKPLVSEEGRVTYCVGILEDITPSVKAERNLQRCMERLEAGGRLVTASRRQSVGEVAESYARALLGALAAEASAVYLYDPYSRTNLAGSAGDWPESPPEDFADLGLPSSVWTSEEGILLRGDEVGSCCSTLGSCLVFPVGEGSSTSGFLLAAFRGEAAGRDLFEMGRLASRMLYLRLQTLKERSERERLEYLVDRHGSFMVSLAEELSIPFALFGGDMKVLAWNGPMADATGLSVERAMANPQNAVDTLFEPAGGLGEVRKRMGGGAEADVPMIWSLGGDADDSRFAWNVALLESPVGVNVEQVMVVSGVPVKDSSLLERANRACDAYRKLERAILRIFTAVDDQVVADTLSETLVAVSGAVRTRVELTAGAVSERVRSGEPLAEDTTSELDIVWKKRHLGTCTVEGGSVSVQARELVSAAATALASISYRRLGRMLSHREGESGHFFSDRKGRLISYLRDSAGSISDVMGEVPEEKLSELSELAVRTGRGVWRPEEEGGERLLVASRLSCRNAAEHVIHWEWTDCHGEGERTFSSGCTDAIRSRLMGLLGTLSASLQSNLNAIARVLEKDDPVRSAVSSSVYELGGIGRVIFYLSLFGAVDLRPRRPISLEKLADDLVQRAVRKGNRPPDIDMGEGLPLAFGQYETLLDMTERLMMLSHTRGVLSIHFDSSEPSSGRGCPVPGIGNRRALVITLGFGSDTPEPSPFSDLLLEADSGFLSRATELGMMRIVMRLSGGALLACPDSGTVRLALPAAGAG